MDVKTIIRNGFYFSFVNEKEFESIYKDIFVVREYDYHSTHSAPFILDCGSHIGVSVIYFKKLYPQSKIIAFEPNPRNFKLLEKNVLQNNLKNVTLVNAAIAAQKGKITFYISKDEENPWTWGDSAAVNKWVSDKTTKTIEVPSEQLSAYIDGPVDLLKLDVEGLEEIVLNEIEGKIVNVKETFIEFHGSSTNPSNDSARIFSFLKDNGFTYTMTQEARVIDEAAIKRTDPYWLIVHGRKMNTVTA